MTQYECIRKVFTKVRPEGLFLFSIGPEVMLSQVSPPGDQKKKVGWRFKVSGCWLDVSDLEATAALTFPLPLLMNHWLSPSSGTKSSHNNVTAVVSLHSVDSMLHQEGFKRFIYLYRLFLVKFALPTGTLTSWQLELLMPTSWRTIWSNCLLPVVRVAKEKWLLFSLYAEYTRNCHRLTNTLFISASDSNSAASTKYCISYWNLTHTLATIVLLYQSHR